MKDNLKRAWSYLESIGYKPYYLAIYGSQNYNLDIYDDEYKSDVDYKCIIIPTIDELVRNSKPLSTVVDFEWGQIEIKDIRSYTESVVKCNVNFLEILCTEHYIWPEFFRREIKNLMSEMWAFYLKACYGMMLEKQEALRHPYPSTKDKIAKYWYDPKQLHHIIRLRILVERYIDNDFPNFSHEWRERDMLIDVKKWYLPNATVDYLVDSATEQIKSMRDSYTKEPVFDTKNRIIEMSYFIIKEQICQNLNQ